MKDTSESSDKSAIIAAVKKVIALKELTDNVLSISFNSNASFTLAQRVAFETFLNNNGKQNRSA